MSPPHIADVYARELSSRGFGYPMWFPEPLKENGYREIRIGDVGFIHKGAFTFLFNVTEPKGSRVNCRGEPADYTPLVYRDTPTVRANALQTKAVCSRSVRPFEVQTDLQADGNVDAGPNYHYRCMQNSGALLLLKDDAVLETVLPNAAFPTYMKTHYENWLRWAQSKDYDVENMSLVLVRGTIKTSEWTVAGFQSIKGSHLAGIEAAFVPTATAGFQLSKESSTDGSVDYRSGSSPKSFHSRRALSSPSGISSQYNFNPISPDVPRDQCIFLQYYKLKYRTFPLQWLLTKMNAAAEYDRHPSDEVEESDSMIFPTKGDKGEAMNKGGTSSKLADPVEIVLDYILSHSNAAIAIACDGDVSALFLDQCWPDDLAMWLSKEQPKIHVHDAVGTLMSQCSAECASAQAPSEASFIGESVNARMGSRQTCCGDAHETQEGAHRENRVPQIWDLKSMSKDIHQKCAYEQRSHPTMLPSPKSLPSFHPLSRVSPPGLINSKSYPGLVIVPQRTWTPAGGPRDYEQRPPIMFSQNGSAGIRLVDAIAHNFSAMPDAAAKVVTSTTSARIAIRIQWPGYEGWFKHINVYNHSNSTEHIFKGRLAHEIAKEVQRCLQELSHARSTETRREWWVTNVSIHQLLLLELRHVAQGSWQPVLARLVSDEEKA